MALWVQKFGGTSVADADCMRRSAEIVLAARAEGHDVVVVVSAMAGETQQLMADAQCCSDLSEGRELAALLVSAEQRSAALFAMALQAQGLRAQSMNAFQVGIHTSHHYQMAQIQSIDEAPIRQLLAKGVIPVVTGFQGIDAHHAFTNLGRGGSDLTAVALAAVLQAVECQIYTDVAGVYRVDPRLLPSADVIAEMHYRELLVMASLGAKVMQSKAVEYAQHHHVCLRVKSTFSPHASGTLITDAIVSPAVTGIVCQSQQVLLRFTLRQQNESAWVESLREWFVDQQMVLTACATSVDATFDAIKVKLVLSHTDWCQHQHRLQKMYAADCEREFDVMTGLAAIGLVGAGIPKHPSLTADILDLLHQVQQKVYWLSSTEEKIILLVDQEAMPACVQILHDMLDWSGCASQLSVVELSDRM